jgi:DNA-binding SARP family transcriptional activator
MSAMTAALRIGGDAANGLAVRLLGPFQLWGNGSRLAIGESPKLQALLVTLAVRPGYRASRETLLTTIWPDRDRQLSNQALNSLTSSLRRTLAEVLGGAAPVVHHGGFYALNLDAGVKLDVAQFEDLARAGSKAARAGDDVAAMALYNEALDLYRGDLCTGPDINSVVERERLRALNMTLLSHVADYEFAAGDFMGAIETALRLLAHDPCREDAHRTVIRCYVRLGQRAQALRQYRLCEQVLREEFDAVPESATRDLFEQVRLNT